MNENIGIIGCGWLGFPLAVSLIKEGYHIYGSTTSEEKISDLQEAGITPFLIAFSEDAIKGDLATLLTKIDVLIINIPPKLRGNSQENFVKKMQLLHQEVKKTSLQKIIFISSTSVYGTVSSSAITEATNPQPLTAAAKQLFAAENIFKKDVQLTTTIIRFGGLIGPDRHPVTRLSGKRELSNGNHPINLIHRNDCIAIIAAVLKNSWWNELLNGVYPEHPTKQQYYTSEALKRGLQIPEYKVSNVSGGKKIDAWVLLNVKIFRFMTTV